jgi:hypothetical protein
MSQLFKQTEVDNFQEREELFFENLKDSTARVSLPESFSDVLSGITVYSINP